MARYATRRKQEVLLFLHLGHHAGLKPLVQTIGQLLIVGLDSPLRLVRRIAHACVPDASETLWNLVGYDVGLASLQPLNHLCRVFANLYAKRNAYLLRELLAKQILQAHAMSVIIVIRLGTRQGKHDQFAIVLDVVDAITQGFKIAHVKYLGADMEM